MTAKRGRPRKKNDAEALQVVKAIPKWLYDLRWLFGYALFLSVGLYAVAKTGWDKGAVKSLLEWSLYGLLAVLSPGAVSAILAQFRRAPSTPPQPAARHYPPPQKDEGQ